MNAFVEMRKFISLNGQVFERLTNVEYNGINEPNCTSLVFGEVFDGIVSVSEDFKGEHFCGKSTFFDV